MSDLAKMVDQLSAERSADKRANSNRQKRKAQVGSLLSWGRESRYIFVIARGKNNLA